MVQVGHWLSIVTFYNQKETVTQRYISITLPVQIVDADRLPFRRFYTL